MVVDRVATEDVGVFAVETQVVARRAARPPRAGTSCWRSATTTIRTCSAFPARICRTCTTTTASRTRYYRQRVVIVGGGNSAAESALELYRAGVARHARPPQRRAEVDDQVLGAAGHREPHQGRVDRGAVQHADLRDPADVRRRRPGPAASRRLPADAVFLLTGYRADCDLMAPRGRRRSSDARCPDVQPRDVRDQRARAVRGRRRDRRATTRAPSSSRTAAFTARRSSR